MKTRIHNLWRGSRNFFKSIVHYFETGDLIPFLIAVSVVHFIGALSQRDPLPIAIAMGIGVDVGMYRIIKAALKYGRWWWGAATVFTGLSFGYHWLYYGITFEGFLFALPMSVLILLLAALSYKENWARKTLVVPDRASNANGVPNGKSGKEESAPKMPRGRYEEFKLAQLARNGAGPMSASEIKTKFGVPTRTAYNWLEKYAKETSAHAPEHETAN